MTVKTIVTGATGFIGNLFVKSTFNNFDLICVGREDRKISHDLKQYSIENIPEQFLFDKVNVLHLATHYSKNINDSNKIKEANIDFGKSLLRRLNQDNILNFIYTNTMFVFDEKNQEHYYTKSKIEFAKIVKQFMDEKKISEIFLDNTFHISDTRAKIIPEVVYAVKNNKKNPINNAKAYINLTFTPDIITALTAEIQSPTYINSRITSDVDVNIGSIFKFLKDVKDEKNFDSSILITEPSRYIGDQSIPPLNLNFIETNLHDNLANLILNKNHK
jgi:nucleoside-diphosphate-sugar epimerase